MNTELVATALFGLAVLHTFMVKRFHHAALFYPSDSARSNFFHLLGEIEVVFGAWAGLLVCFLISTKGYGHAVSFLEGLNFTEPAFVFVIMIISASRPVLHAVNQLLFFLSSLVPFSPSVRLYVVLLTVGPLLGSFITEPAAMTVTALILRDIFYKSSISTKLKYSTLGLLFVNISIGGVLTPFAAPPVLMVAGKWGWDFNYMFFNFGWKAIVAVLLSTAAVTYLNLKELKALSIQTEEDQGLKTPWYVSLIHIIFLGGVVFSAHDAVIFFGLFLFFLGITTVFKRYQSQLTLRESLLVAFFLAGLVVLGGLQKWWLQPLLAEMNAGTLFVGSAALTAITDNAALTYLGSQVDGLSHLSKFYLVAGAVCGGGLTVIANAPNPAGFGILNPHFGPEGISPIGLLKSAGIPTLIALATFWFLT